MAIEIIKLGSIPTIERAFKCTTCKTEFMATEPDMKVESVGYNETAWTCKCPLCDTKCYNYGTGD